MDGTLVKTHLVLSFQLSLFSFLKVSHIQALHHSHSLKAKKRKAFRMTQVLIWSDTGVN